MNASSKELPSLGTGTGTGHWQLAAGYRRIRISIESMIGFVKFGPLVVVPSPVWV